MTTDVTSRADRSAILAAGFHGEFDRDPEGIWAAPGRVNLIGEHTDYNGGLVLPVAIDRRTFVAVARRADDVVEAWSVERGRATVAQVTTPEGARTGGWTAYVAGVVWALREAGVPVPGVDVAVTSEVPIGAGLSSSAALSCATALAVTELAGLEVDRVTLALAAQRAERDIVGAPVGVMDQMASLLSRRDTALFLDCRSLEMDVVPLPPDIALVVIDTRMRHDNASGGYARRRQECEEAAGALGLPSLRDADLVDVDRLPEPLRCRARHVVTENDRVLRTVDALRTGDTAAIAELFRESHASLRYDFEVSVPQLDLAVEAATGAGAVGARLTGGGFGGSVIAIARHDNADGIAAAVQHAFTDAGFDPPSIHRVSSSDAAARVALN